jgi:hypothetical protein
MGRPRDQRTAGGGVLQPQGLSLVPRHHGLVATTATRLFRGGSSGSGPPRCRSGAGSLWPGNRAAPTRRDRSGAAATPVLAKPQEDPLAAAVSPGTGQTAIPQACQGRWIAVMHPRLPQPRQEGPAATAIAGTIGTDPVGSLLTGEGIAAAESGDQTRWTQVDAGGHHRPTLVAPGHHPADEAEAAAAVMVSAMKAFRAAC